MNKKVIGICLIIIVAIGIAIGFTRNRAADASTIKIGLVYGLTGPSATWAEDGMKGAQMATEEINNAGGINDKKIELIIEDSKGDPKTGIGAFNKLSQVDGVKIVVGDVWSVLTNPLIPLADTTKTVLISPSVMNHSVEIQSPYFFTLGHTVESQESAMKKFFSSNPEIKTVYNLCWNDAWGKAHTELLKQITTELKIKIVGESCTSDFNSNYRTEATKVKEVGADAVFITSAYEDTAIKALFDLQVPVKVLTTTGIVEAVRARHFPIAYTKNVWFMDWIPNEEFIAKFEKKYGTYPIMEAQNHYEVIRSIALGMKNNLNNLLVGLKTVKYESTDGTIDFINSDNITVNKAEAKLYTISGDGSFVEVR